MCLQRPAGVHNTQVQGLHSDMMLGRTGPRIKLIQTRSLLCSACGGGEGDGQWAGQGVFQCFPQPNNGKSKINASFASGT